MSHTMTHQLRSKRSTAPPTHKSKKPKLSIHSNPISAHFPTDILFEIFTYLPWRDNRSVLFASKALQEEFRRRMRDGSFLRDREKPYFRELERMWQSRRSEAASNNLPSPMVADPEKGFPRVFLDVWDLTEEPDQWGLPLKGNKLKIWASQFCDYHDISFYDFINKMESIPTEYNPEFLDDPRTHVDDEVMLHSLRHDCVEIENLPLRWTRSKEAAQVALKNWGMDLMYFSDELRNDREVVLCALKCHGYAIQYASQELQQDREIVAFAIQHATTNDYDFDPEDVLHVFQPFMRDESFLRECVVPYAVDLLKYAHNSVRNDPTFMLDMCHIDVDAYMYCSPELHADRSFVLQALDVIIPQHSCTNDLTGKRVMSFICGEFPSDKDVILRVIQIYGKGLMETSEDLRRDVEVVAAAVKSTTLQYDMQNLLECVPLDAMRVDFVCDIVERVGCMKLVVPYLPDEMRSDYNLWIGLAKRFGVGVLEYCSEDLFESTRFVMDAFQIGDASLH